MLPVLPGALVAISASSGGVWVPWCYSCPLAVLAALPGALVALCGVSAAGGAVGKSGRQAALAGSRGGGRISGDSALWGRWRYLGTYRGSLGRFGRSDAS